MPQHIKKVSKKKILFIEIDEELTHVFERAYKLPYKEIYLVVPKRAVLLQSIVNLKILKQKLEEVEKSMALITQDTNGMKLAHQAGIPVFDTFNLENETRVPEEAREATSLLKPIAATQNEAPEESPSRLPKKKSSIFEVVRGLRAKDKGFSLKSYLKAFKKNQIDKQPLSVYLTPGKKRWITGLVLASLLVFGVIVYVALPGATIYIEPASDVLTKAVNVTLTPSPSQPRSLKVYPIEAEAELTLTHPATGVVSSGSQASGTLTIFNTTSQDWPLVKETRFQTEDAVVFRLQEDTVVPHATGTIPGSIVAFVVAEP